MKWLHTLADIKSVSLPDSTIRVFIINICFLFYQFDPHSHTQVWSSQTKFLMSHECHSKELCPFTFCYLFKHQSIIDIMCQKADLLITKGNPIYVNQKYKNKANWNHISLRIQVLNETEAAKRLMLSVMPITVLPFKTEDIIPLTKGTWNKPSFWILTKLILLRKWKIIHT